MVRHRLLVPTFVGSNPATPARVQKSSEMATFSFYIKNLSWLEDEYILKASFTTSSKLLLYFSITYQILAIFKHKMNLCKNLHRLDKKITY